MVFDTCGVGETRQNEIAVTVLQESVPPSATFSVNGKLTLVCALVYFIAVEHVDEHYCDMAERGEPNLEFLSKLLELGISEETAKKALIITNNSSIEAATSVAFDLSDDQWEDLPDEFKMTFVVNNALEMGVGKVASQVAHAAIALYQQLMTCNSGAVQIEIWQQKGEKKIVLRGDNAEHLVELERRALRLHLPTTLIRDEGRTQIPQNSVTVLALFGLEEDVNKGLLEVCDQVDSIMNYSDSGMEGHQEQNDPFHQ